MYLYIQYYAWKKNDWKEKITNKNIVVVPFHSEPYSCKLLRNFLFKKRLGNGNYGTVVLNGEYIGLNLGYKELYLYGVDHNFFDNLCVNEKNQLCNIKTHFYNNEKVLKPISHHYFNKETFYTVYEYLKEITSIFQGHEIMQEYAEYCQAKIFNCTKNSLIDAYEKCDIY
jgi:hypothetical protein